LSIVKSWSIFRQNDGGIEELGHQQCCPNPDDLPCVVDSWKALDRKPGSPMTLNSASGVLMACTAGSNLGLCPRETPEGRITGWYMLLTDIDDRKRAEDALRLNEHDLRLIVDSIPGFVSTANAAGEVELVNRQVLEYFGKTTEELKNGPRATPSIRNDPSSPDRGL